MAADNNKFLQRSFRPRGLRLHEGMQLNVLFTLSCDGNSLANDLLIDEAEARISPVRFSMGYLDEGHRNKDTPHWLVSSSGPMESDRCYSSFKTRGYRSGSRGTRKKVYQGSLKNTKDKEWIKDMDGKFKWTFKSYKWVSKFLDFIGSGPSWLSLGPPFRSRTAGGRPSPRTTASPRIC